MSLIRKLDPRHWRYIRRTFNAIRLSLFSKDPRPSQVSVDASIEEVRAALGRRHFTNAWELSYHYNGEDLNMRRPEYVDDDYNWYQLHIRGFERDDGGVDLHAHFELEPTAHPYGHIEGTNFNISRGAEMLVDILDEEGFEYEDLR